MKDEKRVNKGYKIKDSIYQKAKKKCSTPSLATRIEEVVTAIASGSSIVSVSKNNENRVI
jgi:hypothetical protein